MARCSQNNVLRIFNFYVYLVLYLTILTGALDLPLDELLLLSQFQCFDVQVCTSPVEYCNSRVRECRPCSAEVCARRGGEDFPLQCNLNCTVTHALIKKSETVARWTIWSFVQSHPYLWFRLLMTLVPTSILLVVCWFNRDGLKHKILEAYRIFKRRNVIVKLDEESALLQDETKTCKETQTESPRTEAKESQCPETEDNTGSSSYCNKKLRGTCESNQDTKKNIATNVSQAQNLNQSVPYLLQRQKSKVGVVNEDQEKELAQSKLSEMQQASTLTDT